MSIEILLYSHSEYSFMWKAMIPLLEKFCKDLQINFLIDSGTNIEQIPGHWIIHTYEDETIWTKRVLIALKKIESEYVLFLHEDWLPIGDVKLDILSEMIDFMKSHDSKFLLSYSHISTTSMQEGIPSKHPNYFFYFEKNHIFQPAIWEKNTFIDFCQVLDKTKHQNEDSDCLYFMSNKNCTSIQNIKTVTSLRTTNSYFFPHMHALSEGLWNFQKYPQLKSFLDSFGIDTDTRGTHTWWEIDTQ